MKNFFLKMLTQTVLRDNINLKAHNRFKFLFHADEIKEIPAGGEVNKQIKVTGGCSCSFCP